MDTLFLSFSSILAASLPMMLVVFAVWWSDRFDREPFSLVIRTFLLGCLIPVGLALVLFPALNELIQLGGAAAFGVEGRALSQWRALTGPMIVAPLLEEPIKALVLLPVLLNEEFDNITDGFVYGAVTGLGFAMSENFLYFLDAAVTDTSGWITLVLVRTFYSGIMHATATATVGATLGYARWRGLRTMAAYGLVGLAVAMGIHGVWNGLFVLDDLVRTHGGLSKMNLLIFPLEVLMVWGVFQACIWQEQSTVRSELEEEAEAGRIPKEHPRILASWWRRTGTNWLPEGIPQWSYIHHANLLAMRKWQVRSAGDHPLPRHVDDVQHHRTAIARILNPEEDTREKRRPTAVTTMMRKFRREDDAH